MPSSLVSATANPSSTSLSAAITVVSPALGPKRNGPYSKNSRICRAGPRNRGGKSLTSCGESGEIVPFICQSFCRSERVPTLRSGLFFKTCSLIRSGDPRSTGLRQGRKLHCIFFARLPCRPFRDRRASPGDPQIHFVTTPPTQLSKPDGLRTPAGADHPIDFAG